MTESSLSLESVMSLQHSGQFNCVPSRTRLAFSRNILLQPGHLILTLSSTAKPFQMKGAVSLKVRYERNKRGVTNVADLAGKSRRDERNASNLPPDLTARPRQG